MQLNLKSLLLTALFGSALASASSPSNPPADANVNTHPKPSSSSSAKTTTITLRLPNANTNPRLPNPYLLPSSTHATLTTLGKSLSAPLSTANTFVFRDVVAGSYLVDVHCPTHGFVPLRLDVRFPSAAKGKAAGNGEGVGDEERDGGVRVKAWETFRGNDWGNKGESVQVAVGRGGRGSGGGGQVVEVEVRVAGGKGYFMERSSFSVLSVFKNPIILLSFVSMGLFFGMPKLVENMDPEMRAEWEERQKENPMNSIMGAASGQNANPLGNFDMAAFLAGSGSKTEEGNGNGNGKNKGEGKKKR